MPNLHSHQQGMGVSTPRNIKLKKKKGNLITKYKGTQISLRYTKTYIFKASTFSLSNLINSTVGGVKEGYKIRPDQELWSEKQCGLLAEDRPQHPSFRTSLSVWLAATNKAGHMRSPPIIGEAISEPDSRLPGSTDTRENLLRNSSLQSTDIYWAHLMYQEISSPGSHFPKWQFTLCAVACGKAQLCTSKGFTEDIPEANQHMGISPVFG